MMSMLREDATNNSNINVWKPEACIDDTHPSLFHGVAIAALQWRHDERDSVSIHLHHDCLLIRLFRRRSKKTSKLCVTGLCAGNSPVTGEFPAQGPVTRKMFPFGDVIMNKSELVEVIA